MEICYNEAGGVLRMLVLFLSDLLLCLVAGDDRAVGGIPGAGDGQ